MSRSDYDYYRRRLDDAQERARGASQAEARRAHGELADRYQALLEAMPRSE